MKKLPWYLLLILFWEAAVKISGVSPLLVPAVEDVLRALARDLTQGDLIRQSALSVGMIAGGIAVSFVLSLILAYLSQMHPALNGFIGTVTDIAHPLPGLALMPLILLWFGVGDGAVFAVIVHAAVWPLLLNLNAGTLAVPAVYTETASMLSMSKSGIFFRIRLPYALPYVIAGLKTGWARAWRALISAEMVFGAIGLHGGLGTYIMVKRTFMDTAGLFAGILVIVMIGILVENGLFRFLERAALDRWEV
ncbi:MAG: ABC transporter permease subunit [Lachnospiraceae bacterium]|nr:ABC transporter permease subunit [Lachnospiraceae bacterium]